MGQVQNITQPSSLPTFDELMAQPEGAAPAGAVSKLPTFDELVNKPEDSSAASTTMDFLRSINHYQSPVPDTTGEVGEAQQQFLKHTAVGRIMAATGHAIGEGFGDEHLGLSADTRRDLSKMGILPDYETGQTSILRGINQGLITPAATAADAILRGGSAAFAGAGALVKQAGEEIGLPAVGGMAAEAIEFAAQGAPGTPFAYTHLPSRTPPLITRARGDAVIGEGEGGYFGTKEPTPEQLQERNSAAVAFHTDQQNLNETVEPKTRPPAAPETPAQQTVHDIARQIAPDTFGEYDAISKRRDELGDWMRELSAKRQESAESSAPQNAEIEDLKSKIADAEARGKKTIYTDILEKREAERKEYIDQQVAKLNPDIENVRQTYEKLDNRMRDLAPEVSDAYRKAQEQLPDTETTPPVETKPATESSFQPTEGHYGEFQEQASKPEDQAVPNKIASDVSEKLTAAGRPKEEADAAAELVAAHYQTRAQRFGGMRGSAQEMYERDGADIKAGKSRVKELTQDTGSELAQKARGKIRLATDDAKATITLMKSANASTFIHETGHHWLDELMRDAEHDLAPDELKKDAQTVREWLGNKGGDIETRQHEKFARGFERYLMEGTAPSKQLADVFAKFKAWLSKIYQTVDAFKSPITAGIRDVFNRLLTKNPEKTVIVPEQQAAAESVTPSDAGKGTPATPLESQTESITPKAVPSAEAVKPKKTVSEPPKDPNMLSPKTKTDLVDKDGNIRFENLTDSEDVKEVMRQLAQDNSGFDYARRGVVTDAAVSGLADAAGVTAREVNLKKLRAMSLEDGIPLAVRILLGRQMLVQSAQKVSEMMANTSRGIEDDIAFAEARERHLMVQETVSAITAETGRALRAFKNISGEEIKDARAVTEFLQRETGLTLSQLQSMKKIGVSLDTPAKVAKFLNDSTKPTFGAQVLEYWTNGLISGPATHTTYSVANELLTAWKAIPETLVASAIGDTVKTGESWARVKAMVSSIPTALSAAGKALKSGATTLLPGEELTGLPFQGGGRANRLAGVVGNEAVTWKQLGQDTFGAMKGLRDGFVATAELIKNGGVEDAPLIGLERNIFRAIPNIAIKGVSVLPTGDIANLPYRSVAAIHSFFRTANYSIEKAAGAYRTAVDEGLDLDAFNAWVADVTTNPNEEMMKGFRKNATEMTLMGQGGELTKAMSRLTNIEVGGFKPLKFIDPFVHISSNVIEQSLLKRTPLGLLSSDIRADIMGKNGLEARDYARARMIVGSALGVTWGLMTSQGLTSGSGPSDPKQAALWRLAGNQPHSVKIGDTWYDVHRLGALGLLVSVAADMHDFAHAMSDADLGKVGGLFVTSVAHNILDESFMRGPSDLIRAVSDSDRYGAAYVRNFISSFVPFSVGMSQTARAIDPYTRQARSVTDAIIAKLPWRSEELYPKRDIWGDPIANKSVLGPAGLSAIYETKVNNDPVNKTLLQLGIYPGSPERKIRGVPLSDEQYDEYSKLAGRTTKMRLDAVVKTPGFERVPENAQTDIIKNIMSASRETARNIVMMKNPDIIRQATEAKMKAIRGSTH